jgi:multidrug efflux pump subunit AcrB
VALVTQTFLNGAPLSQFREHEDLVDIVARAVPGERLNLETLKSINLYTRDGTVVPLSQVARVATSSRSRCCGGATATWRSRSGPT